MTTPVSTIRTVNGNFSSSTLVRSVDSTEPLKLGSKLRAWWDASSGVALTSGKVNSWIDRKNGYNLVQATTSLQPAYLATGVNGLPAIQGDGVDDFLSLEGVPGLIPTTTAGSWLVIVGQGGDVDANVHTIFGYGAQSPSNARRSIRRSGTDYPQLRTELSNLKTGFQVADKHVIFGHFVTGGASIDGRTDTTDWASPVATAFSTGVTRVRFGASVDSVVAEFSAYKAAHLLVLDDTLTADDLARISTWAMWKLGILVF